MSFFGGIRTWFSDQISSQAPQQSIALLCQRGAHSKLIESGHHYFRIWLKDMRLGRTRHWFTDLYPATHGLTALQFGDSSLEIASLIGPMDLGKDINKDNIGVSVIINKPLTPLLPFKGGTVSLDAGLVSIPAEGGMSAFLNSVSRFAQMLDVPQVSSVVNLAEPVAASIGELLLLDGPAVRLNYSATFAATGGGSVLEDCMFVVASLPDGTLDPDQLWVVDHKLRVGDSPQDAGPLDDCDYLLFHIERVDARDDWEQFADIAEPIQAAMKAALEGKAEEVEFQIMTARAKVLASPDLTRVDQFRILREIEKRKREITDLAGPRIAGDEISLPPSEFAQELMARALPVQEARATLPPGEGVEGLGGVRGT